MGKGGGSGTFYDDWSPAAPLRNRYTVPDGATGIDKLVGFIDFVNMSMKTKCHHGTAMRGWSFYQVGLKMTQATGHSLTSLESGCVLTMEKHAKIYL